ncbi:hypothetical protein JOE11_005272 [Robbsia andropogonis]
MILVVCGSTRAEGQTMQALSLLEHRLMPHGCVPPGSAWGTWTRCFTGVATALATI